MQKYLRVLKDLENKLKQLEKSMNINALKSELSELEKDMNKMRSVRYYDENGEEIMAFGL